MRYICLLVLVVLVAGLEKEDCQKCEEDIELGIVLDVSVSIYFRDLNRAKDFVNEFLSYFAIDEGEARVSLVPYGRYVHDYDVFNLTTYHSLKDIQAAITGVSQPEETFTATGLAMAFMRDYQLNSRVTRPGVRRVGLVITDGNSQDYEGTAREASRAREQGINMFAIGVGTNVDNEELVRIAGSPARVDRVDSYSKLVTITKWLVDETCNRIA